VADPATQQPTGDTVQVPDPLEADTVDQADMDRAPELEDLGTWHDPYRDINWQAFRVNRKRGDRE
jgi:hypothetical protein